MDAELPPLSSQYFRPTQSTRNTSCFPSDSMTSTAGVNNSRKVFLDAAIEMVAKYNTTNKCASRKADTGDISRVLIRLVSKRVKEYFSNVHYSINH